MKKCIALTLTLAMLVGCSRHERITTNLDSLTGSKEAVIGHEINDEIMAMFDIVDDPVLNVYVTNIGNRIASISGRKDLHYQFIILNDSRIYTMHAPGGYVYVTVGTFEFLHNEIELAGMLAHEISALQFKDPEFSGSQKALKHLTRATSYIGPIFGSVGALALLSLVVLSAATGKKKSIERQLMASDKKALQLLVKAGYDPQGYIDPLRRMQNPRPEFRPFLYDHLKSHPITEKRFEKIEKEFYKLNVTERKFQSGRERYLGVMNTLKTPALSN
jgi:predicted Zn-dependent protease